MRIFLFLIMLLTHFVGYSQSFRCSFDGPAVKPIVYQPDTEEEMELEEEIFDIGEDILEELGISTDHYTWRAASNIRNFQAELNPRTWKVEISYNLNFIKNLYKRLSEDDFEVVITVCLCHEIGHQLCGHTYGNGGTPESELAADLFAGKTIGRWASEDEMDEEEALALCLKAYKLIASVGATTTHPGRAARIEAFTEGFEDQW